jgi:hypothetical protein
MVINDYSHIQTGICQAMPTVVRGRFRFGIAAEEGRFRVSPSLLLSQLLLRCALPRRLAPIAPLGVQRYCGTFSFLLLCPSVSGDPKASGRHSQGRRRKIFGGVWRNIFGACSSDFPRRCAPIAALVSCAVVENTQTETEASITGINVLQERPIPAERDDLLETRLHAWAWEFEPNPSRDCGSRKERWTAAIGELLAAWRRCLKSHSS